MESIKENSKTRSQVMNEQLVPRCHASAFPSHSSQEVFAGFARPSPRSCDQGPLLQFYMSALPFPDVHLWFYEARGLLWSLSSHPELRDPFTR